MANIEDHIKTESYCPAYLFYGEENLLKRQSRDQLLAALVRPGDTMNFTKYEGKQKDFAAIVSQSQTAPFLAKYRVILLENTAAFSTKQDELGDYLKSPCPSTVLIFLEKDVDRKFKAYKAIASTGHVQEFNRTNPDVIAAWAGKRIKDAGLRIDREAWAEFCRRTNSSMDNMDQELDKLFAYVGEQGTITLDDVKAITTKQLNTRIFDMIDAIGEKNITKALNIYQDLLASRAVPLMILKLMTDQLNFILIVKKLRDDGLPYADVQRRIKKQDWQTKKANAQAAYFSTEELMGLLQEALDLDQASKTGRLDPQLAVEILILKAAQGRS